jgi:CRP/FNR family transcriptional regulator
VAFGAGQIALLSTLFGSEPSPIDLVVLEPLRWSWLDRRQLEATLSEDPGGLLLLTRFLGARLREVQHRERGWLGRGLQVRLCAVLRRMVREAQGDPGCPSGDGPVRLRVTHERLAHRCGLSRPRTSQALKRLERAGAVRLGRGQIEVLDAAALHGGGPC